VGGQTCLLLGVRARVSFNHTSKLMKKLSAADAGLGTTRGRSVTGGLTLLSSVAVCSTSLVGAVRSVFTILARGEETLG